MYGYELRDNIWTCSECVCAQGQYMDLQYMGMYSGQYMDCSEWVCAQRQYMFLRKWVWDQKQYEDHRMGMYSGAVYGPAVYGYVLRGNIWTCSIRV